MDGGRSRQPTGSARCQTLFVLNVRSNKIYEDTVNNVHCDKHLGLAKIRPQDIRAFYVKYFPDILPKLDAYIKKHPDSLILDFENHWTALECLPPYTTVLEVATIGHPRNDEDLINLACFIAIQNLRSHSVMKSMLEVAISREMPRFEYYWILKNLLSDVAFLNKMIEPIAMAKWTFYVMDHHTFPIPETTVLVRDGTILIALSPRLLAQLDLTRPNPSPRWESFTDIPESIAAEYRCRCIGNTFKEILFSDRMVLEEWKATPEFARRVQMMKQFKTYNEVIASDDSRKIWKINAFSNLL